MKKRNHLLASAVRSALCLSAAVCLASPALAQSEGEERAAELDRVQVTGSRIMRTDIEGALPVTVIDREDLELNGEVSVADIIRNLPFNSTGSTRPQSGSSAQGVNEVALRGLGSNRTLVLVNGRRLAKSPSTGSSQDLTNIPLGAVERIEILTDGASAVYGSDAIGGVINVVLRKDFEGAEIVLGTGDPNIPANGGDRYEGSVVIGSSGINSSIMAGFTWNRRDIVFARDFPWTSAGASVYGNSFTSITNGFDDFNWTAIPGACDFSEGPGFYLVPNSNAVAGGQRCAYDFTLVSADEASTGVKSGFIRGEYEFAPNWSVFSDVWVAKTESFGRYAPVPDSSFFSSPLPADSPNNPTNPNSAFYDPAFGPNEEVNWWHRFDALGNRDQFVNNELTDVLVGVKGFVGQTQVEAGWRNTENKTYDIGYNYLVRTTADDFIADGTYDLGNPYAADDSVLNAMKATISRISRYDQWEAFASAAWDMFETPAGSVQWVLGVEYREEDYFDQYDSLSEAGAIGGSAGNSAGGTRDVTSAYFESLVPALDTLEFSFAGRYDKYSDYGSDFSPKVAFKWDAMEGMIIRGSFGEGFLAPTLDIITQLDAFSADTVNDEQSCVNQAQPPTCSLQINALRTANPSLSSEQSDQFSFGIAFAPTQFDWINGTIDYWDTEITNRINFFSAQEIINKEAAGDPVPAGLGVSRAPNGSIVEVVTGFGNEGNIQISGIDLNLQTNFDLFAGTLTTNVIYAHLLDYKIDGGRDIVMDPGVPEYRAVLQNNYRRGDFSVAWNLNVIGDQFDDIVDGVGEGHVPTWVTHDVQFNYFTPWNGKITFGALNVGDKEPPINLGDFGSRDYDFGLYSGFGRISYARYTHTF